MKNILFSTLTILSGLCSYGQPIAGRDVTVLDSMPVTWEYDTQYFQTTPSEDKWWETFGDPILTSLISKAVDNNYDVLTAQHRIEAARQVYRAAKADYFPTVDINAGWNLDATSGTIHKEHTHAQLMKYFSLGLSMNWEIDVFGRVQAKIKSAKASYQATGAEYDATLVSLCSNLAKAYIQLRKSQCELEIAKRTVANNEENLKLAKARFDAGLRPALDVLQGSMSVTQAKATIPPLKQNIAESLNAIALLCGVFPSEISYLSEPMPLPDVPDTGSVGNPEALLRRRPDIVEAERQLAAKAAAIGIAKKDFLPTLSVSASFGVEGQRLQDLFRSDSHYFTIMPTLTWTIFDGMARNARLAEARAAMEETISQYNLTVMTALCEVNNAISNWETVSEQMTYNDQLLRDSRHQLSIQIDRYKQGLNGFSDVTGAEITVLQYETNLIDTHAAQLNALVTLYTALGGGW